MKREFIELDPRTALAIGILMVLAGILFTGWKINRIALELSSYSWEEAEGEMVSSRFETKNRWSNGKTKTTYYGIFTYEYLVSGIEYAGRRYDATGSMSTGLKKEADEFKEQLERSKNVLVYYDPHNPQSSMLKKGISEDTSVRLLFSLFLSAVGCITIRYQIKRMKGLTSRSYQRRCSAPAR